MKLYDSSRLQSLPSNRVFRFGDTSARSERKIEVILRILFGVNPIQMAMKIEDMNISSFLGQDHKDAHGL